MANPCNLSKYEKSRMLGRYIRELREKHLKISITALADKIGISHSTISRYEAMQRTPDPGYLAYLMCRFIDKIGSQNQVEDCKTFLLRDFNTIIRFIADKKCDDGEKSNRYDTRFDIDHLSRWEDLETLKDQYLSQNRKKIRERKGQSLSSFQNIPIQRPPRSEYFTGREPELEQLLEQLQPGRVVTLCGPGGIGKTALAAEAVWRLAPRQEPPARFPDGIVFYSFYGKLDPALALEHIARTFGEEPKPTPTDAALRALADKQALLLLDGTEEVDDLRSVLDITGRCGVLVTSRSRQDAAAVRQDIKPLLIDAAVALLCKWGGDQTADSEASTQICKLIGCLPLAVRLVGRYLAETDETVAEYLAWLKETPIQALSRGKHRQESVEVLLEKSLTQVSEQAEQLLTAVGLLALDPFGREPLASALDIAPNQLRQPLGELVSYGLLLHSGDRYEVSHALIHTYARRRMVAPNAAAARLAEYYIQSAKKKSEMVATEQDRSNAERAHWIAVLEQCVKLNSWNLAAELVRAMDKYLEKQGYWVDRIRVVDIGINAARELDDQQGEVDWLRELGVTYYRLGKFSDALDYYQKAKSIANVIKNKRAKGEILSDSARILHDQGQVKQAMEYYQQARAIASELEDHRDLVEILGRLGLVYHDLAMFKQARESYEEALTISREFNDRDGEGAILGYLGLTYCVLGFWDQAIKYLKKALTITTDRRRRQLHLGDLGTVYYYQGETDQAIKYYKKALTLAREIRERRNEGSWLGYLGRIYRHNGQVEKAIEYHQKALKIADDVGYRRNKGIHLGDLGQDYFTKIEMEHALNYFEQARKISYEVQDRRHEAVWLGWIGAVYLGLDEQNLAEENLQQAEDIFKEIEKDLEKLYDMKIKLPSAIHARKCLNDLKSGNI